MALSTIDHGVFHKTNLRRLGAPHRSWSAWQETLCTLTTDQRLRVLRDFEPAVDTMDVGWPSKVGLGIPWWTSPHTRNFPMNIPMIHFWDTSGKKILWFRRDNAVVSGHLPQAIYCILGRNRVIFRGLNPPRMWSDFWGLNWLNPPKGRPLKNHGTDVAWWHSIPDFLFTLKKLWLLQFSAMNVLPNLNALLLSHHISQFPTTRSVNMGILYTIPPFSDTLTQIIIKGSLDV